MPSEDYSEWWKDFMGKAVLGSGYTELSYYNPKHEFNTLTKTYYVYIQPVVLLILTVWLIALIRALWTDDYIKKFGFMTLYSCIDLLTLIIQDGFYSYAFTLKNNYLEYDICYAFEICTLTVPLVLIFVSQWLKVAQAFQRFIVLYKPMEYRKIFNARSVAVFFVAIVIGLGSIATMSIRCITFERVVIIDRASMETVDICRKPGFFSKDEITLTEHVSVETILLYVFQSMLPFIFMSIFSIASIIVITKHVKYRKQFQLRSTATDIASERLVKVTIVTTIVSATLTIPRLPVEAVFDDETVPTFEYIAIASSALFIINIPVTFLLFSWLSEGFRKTVKQIWKRLRNQSSSGYTDRKNIN